MITYGVEGLSTVAILQRSKMCIFFDFSYWFYRRFISLSWWYIHMFLFWGYNKRTKIDKVYCLGLHHFRFVNTICLCWKSIWADDRVVINNNALDWINSTGILAIHFMMGYVHKFEISCKKVLISMFLFLQIMGY